MPPVGTPQPRARSQPSAYLPPKPPPADPFIEQLSEMARLFAKAKADRLTPETGDTKKDRVKLAGNAVTPPVMTWIMGRVIQALEVAS